MQGATPPDTENDQSMRNGQREEGLSGSLVVLPCAEGQGEFVAVRDPKRFRSESVANRRAIRGGWVSDEIGHKTAEQMATICFADPEASRRDRIQAARTLATLAAVDVRREQAHDQTARHEDNQSLAQLRALLSTPEGRQALAQLSARPAQGQADPPAPSTPSTKCDAPESTQDGTSEEAGDGT